MNQFSRTEMVLGTASTEKLNKSSVLVFGLGGVGSYVVESLARSGVGRIGIVDNDTVNESNINRQIIALHSTVGRAKTDVVEERIHDINPACTVDKYTMFYLPENASKINLADYDYIVDAIDTVSSKIEIAETSFKKGYRLISCMGTGNKTDPLKLKISDIFDTSVCPLCRVMRRELKKRDVSRLCVLWSDEEPVKVIEEESSERVPGSTSFVPSVAGLIISSKVIKDLLEV